MNPKRKKQTKHTFQIESLIDAKGSYIGTFCALTGELLYHSDNEQKQAQEEEVKEEIKDENQLQLFL